MHSSTLNSILASGDIPPALLFTGPKEAGALTAALDCAQHLTGSSSMPHPDVHVYEPEGKSRMHTMEAIHGLIAEVAFPPFQASYKIFILIDAERMPPACSNALLKTLEEPGKRTLFILVTAEPEALLSTITSRCRKVVFHAQAKQKQPPILIECLKQLHTQGVIEAISKIEEDLDVLPWEEVLEQLFFWYRDLHLLNAKVDPKFLYYQDQQEALNMHLARSPEIPSLERILDVIEKCRYAVQHNVKRSVALKHALVVVVGMVIP